MSTRKIRVRGKHGLYTRTIKVAQKSPKAGAYLRAVAHGTSQGVGTGLGFIAGGRAVAKHGGSNRAIATGLGAGSAAGYFVGHQLFMRSRMGQKYAQDWHNSSDWGRVGLTAAKGVGNVAGSVAGASLGAQLLIRWNRVPTGRQNGMVRR
jgi:hypothetical protein